MNKMSTSRIYDLLTICLLLIVTLSLISNIFMIFETNKIENKLAEVKEVINNNAEVVEQLQKKIERLEGEIEK